MAEGGEATNDDVFASLDHIFVDNAEIDAAFPSSDSPERHAEQSVTAAEPPLRSSVQTNALASLTLAWNGGQVPWSTAAAAAGGAPVVVAADALGSDHAADDYPPPPIAAWLGQGLGTRSVQVLAEEGAMENGIHLRQGAIPRSSSVNWLWNATCASAEGKYESPATTPRSPGQVRTLNLGEDRLGDGASTPVDFLFRGASSALKRAQRAARKESLRISSLFSAARPGQSGADSAHAALAAARQASVNGAKAVRASAMRGAVAVTKWSKSAKYLPLRLTGKTRARIASSATALIVLILVLSVIAWTGQDPPSSLDASARALPGELIVTSRGLTTSKELSEGGQLVQLTQSGGAVGAANRSALLSVNVRSDEDGAAAALSSALDNAVSSTARSPMSPSGSAWLSFLRPVTSVEYAARGAAGGAAGNDIKLQLRERLRAKVVAKFEVDSAQARHDKALRAEEGAKAADEVNRRSASTARLEGGRAASGEGPQEELEPSASDASVEIPRLRS